MQAPSRKALNLHAAEAMPVRRIPAGMRGCCRHAAEREREADRQREREDGEERERERERDGEKEWEKGKGTADRFMTIA